VYGLNERKYQIVKVVTVAPEVESVLDSMGDLVHTGHSSATVAKAESTVEKEARFITHLINAMQQFHHIHHRDPGIIGLLGTTRLYYGIICDGIHMHPNSIKMAYDSHPKGAVLVTDAMTAMGLPPGDYTLGDIRCVRLMMNELKSLKMDDLLDQSLLSMPVLETHRMINC
ncbi:9810_t:CDS:2, partial [Gigaspora rosea]